MRNFLAMCLVLACLAAPSAMAQEERYSPNMTWLRQTQPVMRFYIDFFEPLERADQAALLYLTGDLSRESALYELESARSSIQMISENIEWSIDLLPPAPEGGPAASSALIGQMQNLTARLHDLRASMDQSVVLLETFVKDNNYPAYKGGVRQSVAAIETISGFVDPYNEIARLGTPAWDTLSLNSIAAAKLDDILTFRMISLFYSSAILSEDFLPEDRMKALVGDLEHYSDAIDRIGTSIDRARKELEAEEDGYPELYMRNLKQLSTENEARRKRLSAYHKLLAAYSMPVFSPDLVNAAFGELQEAYDMDLPAYERARRNAISRQNNAHSDEGSEETEAVGFDTPL